jgi:myo-inositol-1(or 4)-monophosphatase
MTVEHDTDAPPVEPGLISRALEVAGRLANDAAEVLTATADRDRGPAYPFDWVTDTGRTLERHTRRVLASAFPTIPLDAPGSPYRWVVDPVDGAANYVAGFPWCAYSLALVDRHGPVVGVIADPNRAQIYAAARGRGVRANGVPVRVSARQAAGGLVCAELGPGRAAPFGAGECVVRVLGSAALAITQVALGHAVAAVLDGAPEKAVAGALCLAKEAGAVVVDDQGRADPLPSGAMVVAGPGALDDVLRWWRAA